MPPIVNKLPPPETARWGAVRKATVVRGVQAGLLTLEEACVRYSISADEFAMWEGRLARHGVRGLRVHGLRDLRSAGERNSKGGVRFKRVLQRAAGHVTGGQVTIR